MAHGIEDHFAGRDDVVRDIYDIIVSAASDFGPVVEDPKKTSIHLNRRSAFAGVKTQRSSLILTLKSAEDIDSPRIRKSEQASASRWYHDIRLDDTDQIDRELIHWLRHSYEIS